MTEKTIKEPARDIPVASETDVLVIGAGPAGLGAAIAAARNGAKVLVLEQSGMPGGVSTAGLMSHWTGTSGSKLYREVLRRSAEMNEGELHGKPVIEIDPEKLKLLYYTMLDEAGASLRCYTFVSEPIMEGDRIRGVIAEHLGNGEREYIACDTLVTALGLIPERELIRGLEDRDWLSLVGNCSKVHDIVDSAAAEAARIGSQVGKQLAV